MAFVSAKRKKIKEKDLQGFKYFKPISALLEAAGNYQRRLRRRITFEYVLLGGFNDTAADAARLTKLVQDIPCKVNVIPWNPVDGRAFERPQATAVEAFVETLAAACITATVRHSKGAGIAAGCGQLYWQG